MDVLNKDQRRARISLVEKRVRLFSKTMELGRGLTANQLAQQKEDMAELVQLKRIDHAEESVLYFMYEYFSDNRNPENEQNLIPAGVNVEDAPAFHGELCEILDEVSNVNIMARVGWAAPRGVINNKKLP